LPGDTGKGKILDQESSPVEGAVNPSVNSLAPGNTCEASDTDSIYEATRKIDDMTVASSVDGDTDLS
jgi:hypothetical protein